MPKRFFFFTLFLLILGVSFLFSLANVYSKEDKSEENVLTKGEKLFKANCAGCHQNGQNLIKPNKPVIGSKYLKFKKAFADFLESPPPPMPDFENISTMPGQLDALYSYSLTLMGK